VSRLRLLFPLCLILTFCLAGTALAQPDSGVITGKVTDRYGEPLKKVSVRASNLDDGLVVESLTGDKGVYKINQMSPGTYEVQISLGPMGIRKRQIRLDPGQTVRVDFVFQVEEERGVDPNYRPSPPSMIN
jgi:hypothetical protein